THDPSYLLRINKKTGKTVWRVERPTQAIRESPDSYTTPTLVKDGNHAEIVVTGGDCMTGHDPTTGQEIWRANGFNPDNDPFHRIIASAVVADGVIYAPTKVRPLLAFRTGGKGDISQSHLLWSFHNGPDVPSPLSDGKYFFSINDKGIAWCLDAKTGKEIWGPERLKPAIYSASPVLADGKIYVINEDGLTTVLRAGPKFEVLAENPFNEYTLSSPAISDGQIFIRTAKFLYCIGKRGNQ
ncbi:MAG: PQQ-binding-like beta-propeller repeat protein, partial [Terriglobia bacterium]